MALNIASDGRWPANVLSNFAATPFVLDGVECASAEGFIQALKFPDPAMQREMCRLVGLAAKRRGRSGTKRVMRQQKVWWQGEEFRFRSSEHFALVERGLRAKFTQSNRARRALVATRKGTLKHDLGRPESVRTSLPAREFIGILYRIRSDLQAG